MAELVGAQTGPTSTFTRLVELQKSFLNIPIFPIQMVLAHEDGMNSEPFGKIVEDGLSTRLTNNQME